MPANPNQEMTDWWDEFQDFLDTEGEDTGDFFNDPSGPYDNMPDGGQFGDYTPGISRPRTGFVPTEEVPDPNTQYVSVRDNPEIFTDLGGQRGQQGGQTNMADGGIDWNRVFQTGAGSLAVVNAIGNSGGGSGRPTTPTPTGSGFNFWDAVPLLLSGYQAYQASKAAKDAAKLNVEGNMDAAGVVRQSFLDTKETLQPYTDSGIPALNRRNVLLGLSGTPEDKANAWGNVYDDPVLTQQNELVRDEVNRGASATGQLKSGNRLAALSDRLQRIKYDFGQQYLNRMDTGVNTGYGAAAATGGVAANAANTQAQYLSQSGDDRATGRLSSQAAYQSGLNDIYGQARDTWG